MTLIQEAIRAKLVASTGVSSLVGTTAAPRIYHFRLPEGAQVPAIRYQEISRLGYPDYTTGGRLTQKRIQIDSWANTGESAATLADQVRRALDGFSGVQSTLTVSHALLIDESGGYDTETKMHRVRQDYTVMHLEST